MELIDPTTYKNIADLIDYAQDRGEDIKSFIDQMQTDLDDSEIPTTNTYRNFLESSIAEASAVIEERHIQYTSQMTKFVRDLQTHVDNNYSGTVNDYLSNNSIKVLPVFADISDVVGFPIDAENIENIS